MSQTRSFSFALNMVLACGVASAGYVGSVVGLSEGGQQADTLTVSAGDVFTAGVLLESSDNAKNDSAIFRLAFSVANLEHDAGWYEWGDSYTTGGIDDRSRPGSDESGVITSATHLDPFDPDAVDVYFENLTDNFGQYFSTGLLLTFTLRVPQELIDVGSFTIGFIPDTLTDGASIVDTSAGGSLVVNVIPAPSTLVSIAAVGLCSRRRRRRVTRA